MQSSCLWSTEYQIHHILSRSGALFFYPRLYLQEKNSPWALMLIGQWWPCRTRPLFQECGGGQNFQAESRFMFFFLGREWRTSQQPMMSGCSQPAAFVLSGEEDKRTEASSLIGESDEGAELGDSQETPVPDALSLRLQAGGCWVTQTCIVHLFNSGQRCLHSTGQSLLNFLELICFLVVVVVGGAGLDWQLFSVLGLTEHLEMAQFHK